MDRKQLSKYYHLSQEIKEVEEKLQTIREQMPSGSRLTGMPFSSKKSDPTERKAELIMKYTEILEIKKEKAMEEMIKIENFIATIEDIEARRIFNKRYIELKRWDLIAREMGMSESTVFRKHRDFIKEIKNV